MVRAEQEGTSIFRELGNAADDAVSLCGDYGYFSGTDSTYGAEPWHTDGTMVGTLRLADINPGVADSLFEPLGCLRCIRIMAMSCGAVTVQRRELMS